MIELAIFLLLLLLLILPCGHLLAKFTYESFNTEKGDGTRFGKIYYQYIEQPIYKICSINISKEMTAKEYFFVLFNTNLILCAISFIALYFQNILPFNDGIKWDLDIPLILHIISSQITNTCQTHHIPEQHLTPLSNFYIMPLLMFYSSGSGIATAIVVIRSISIGKIGNAYVDVIKSMVRLLIPLSLLSSFILSGLGSPNTFKFFITYKTIEESAQKLILGPISAFEGIKLIGENGLSCLNANSAHPFESPSYLSNFIQMASILIIPVTLIITFGLWIKNKKQSFMILAVLFFMLIAEIAVVTKFEILGNLDLNKLISIRSENWVGKETRFGIVGSSIFTATISNISGSANSALESFNPITVAIALFNLSNQSIFGVQGFGFVFTLNFIIYTAFLTGLMLGKTPEVFNKRIEKQQMITSSILILINPILVLLSIGITLLLLPEISSNQYDKVHYYTKVFYEFASGAASNGSGLESLNDNTPYWNSSLAIVMFIARYAAMSAMIFLGGSFINKPKLPITSSTLKTDTALFSIIFLFFSIISTLLTYSPFILIGPITEFLTK